MSLLNNYVKNDPEHHVQVKYTENNGLRFEIIVDGNVVSITNNEAYEALVYFWKCKGFMPTTEHTINGENADPWKHRSIGMRCRTCMWCVLKDGVTDPEKKDNPRVGRCRRRAPTMNGYPVVFENDWCGDHRIDENKI